MNRVLSKLGGNEKFQKRSETRILIGKKKNFGGSGAEASFRSNGHAPRFESRLPGDYFFLSRHGW